MRARTLPWLLLALGLAGAWWFTRRPLRRGVVTVGPITPAQLPDAELPAVALPALPAVSLAPSDWLAPLLEVLPVSSSGSRGIRNNNPGNIRRSATAWQGKVLPGLDPDFEQFSSPYYGLRALARTLLSYQARYGLGSVRALISRWAPPSENNTAAYVAAVAAEVGQGPDNAIDLRARPDLLAALVAAIVRHENGVQPYALADIRQAVGAALA